MILAQIISIVGMILVILSFQGKKPKTIIALQLTGDALFAISFIMMDAFSGGILNAIAVVRALLFLKKDKFKTDRLFWLFIFIALYLMAYAATFLIFHKAPTPFNLFIEFLPVIGMTSVTLGYRRSEAKSIRRFGIISSCSWLSYNIISGSIGAICCETLSIISIIVGMIRFDIGKKAKIKR